MKKIVVLLCILLILWMGFSVKMIFFNDSDNEPVETITDHNDDEIEEKTEEPVEIIYPDNVFRMLDFDRRLILRIGQQDEELCSIFNLAYARSILDGKIADPYDYFDGDGAVWSLADYGDIAMNDPLLTVLQRAYEQIDAGRPVIFFVSGTYGYTTAEKPIERISYDHYVLLIGYRMNADYDDLKPSDFYAADPSNGYCCSADGYMPWIILSDDSPELVSGEYALYAQTDKDDHVDTCIAYVDTCTWDSDLKEAIYPDYY